MRLLWPAAALLLLCACAAPFRYYGDYSIGSYLHKSHPNGVTRADLKASLEKVIAKSKAKQIKVPPGLYCEYALVLLEEERNAEARKYLLLERQNWPESRVLVDHLLERYQLGHQERR